MPRLPRPCLNCGQLTDNSRCLTCNRERERIASAARPPRPHYSGDYRKRAKIVRETAIACHWCGGGFAPDNPVQADHVLQGDPASPLVASCRRCNIARANRARWDGGR